MRFIVQEIHNQKFRLDYIAFLAQEISKAHIIDIGPGYSNVAAGCPIVASGSLFDKSNQKKGL